LEFLTIKIKGVLGSLFAIATILLTFNTIAGSNVLFFTGTQLYNMCRDTGGINQAACEGYILGVQDTIYSGYLSEHFNLCFPNGVGPAQLRLQLIQFMEKNPNTMNFAAEGVVAKSLEVAFSCGAVDTDKQEEFITRQ
jgi:hypothetical protein